MGHTIVIHIFIEYDLELNMCDKQCNYSVFAGNIIMIPKT